MLVASVLGLKPFGGTKPPPTALRGPGLQHGEAFLVHSSNGLIEQQAQAFG